MRILVFTCDQYVSLIEGWSNLFNKHWGNSYHVDVIGFKEPDFELPANFTFHSAGNQDDFSPMAFHDPFMPIIDSFPEEYFVLFLDDTFLISNVNHECLQHAKKKIESKAADSIFLFWGGPEQFRKAFENDENFLEFPQEMDYRVNVQPQLVTKEYFKKYMTEGKSIRSFEVDNIKAARNNGATILCGKTPIAPWANIIRGGKFNPHLFENLNKTDGKTFAWNEWQVFEDGDIDLISKYKNWEPGK